jgi:uncharacterized protein (UPF0332 family)
VTDENCRLNIQFEWEKAGESLVEVEALVERNLWAAAISMAYYGMFHMARALLFSLGLEARSHSGLVHLLNAHLVRAGEFPREMAHTLSRLQRLREDADYQAPCALTWRWPWTPGCRYGLFTRRQNHTCGEKDFSPEEEAFPGAAC